MRRVSTPSDHVVTVGAGTSALVESLLDSGYDRITAVDISPAALEALKQQLGSRASAVRYLEADARSVEVPAPAVVWHDRAAFHFLTDPGDQAAYAINAARSVPSGGHLVLAAFAIGGPEQCSGLATQQHSPDTLVAVFGDAFELVDAFDHHHTTPGGADQLFVYGVLRRS